MGSVLSEVNCPKCGFERAMVDYYYKSGEEYVRCYQCGYASDLFMTCPPKNGTVFGGHTIHDRLLFNKPHLLLTMAIIGEIQ